MTLLLMPIMASKPRNRTGITWLMAKHSLLEISLPLSLILTKKKLPFGETISLGPAFTNIKVGANQVYFPAFTL